MKQTYRYTVLEHDTDPRTVEANADGNWEYLAVICAEHYHGCGGWDSSWPLTFVLFDNQDNELGRYEVDREISPVFIASKAKNAQ